MPRLVDRSRSHLVTVLVAAMAVALLPLAARADHAQVTNPAGTGGGDGLVRAVRWAGDDRFATAAKVAVEFTTSATGDPATSVVVATGADFPDALAATHLAGAVGGPILLTGRDRLPGPTREVLAGDGPSSLAAVTEAFVVGGTGAISAGVVAELEALGLRVSRIAGEDRIATAIAVATGAPGDGGVPGGRRTALLARADDFADALAAGPLAAGAGLPLLLTGGTGLDGRVADALDDLGVTQVVLVGGTKALGRAVVDDLRAAGVTTRRVAGADRAATAATVADLAVDEFAFSPDRIGLARGTGAGGFADALALAALAGRDRYPVVLTPTPEALAPATWRHLDGLATCAFDAVSVAGGTASVGSATLLAAREALTAPGCDGPPPTFDLLEATLADVRAAFAGRQVTEDGEPLTCVALAEAYVARIDAMDDLPSVGQLPLFAVTELSPVWREQAEALDEAYAEQGPTGRLHCAPILLKDLYDTVDAPTTSASLSLLGSRPPDDAFTVARMRGQGALFLGKTTMTEFAYFTQSYNSRTGRVALPYDTTLDAGGSSGGSGAAIAANFALLGTGSDTCASIRLPPSNSSLVGIRSTVGLVSQDGLVPLSHTLDVGGPITRTVTDAATLLDVMAGTDPADPMTADPERFQPESYTTFLDAGALDGARIGVLRAYGGSTPFGNDDGVDAVVEQAIADMATAGATIVEDVELPDFETVATGLILQEFADHLDEYLGSFDAPKANTVEVFASGMLHPVIEALVGASIAARDTESDGYLADLATREEMRTYVESEMDRLDLDALVYPPVRAPAQEQGNVQGDNCSFTSTTSMPSIVVPAGDVDGLPVGVEIAGRRWDEGRIIGLGFAYEQATNRRFRPSLAGDPAP